MKNLAGAVRRCITDYNMISDGDRVAVGLSGGKDSVTLLALLAELRQYLPQKFELAAITLSMGFPETDFSPPRPLVRIAGRSAHGSRNAPCGAHF